MSRIRYKVDNENKVVVATMKDVRYDASAIINKCYGGDKLSVDDMLNLENMGILNDNIIETVIPDRYSGVAKCHDDDVFDEELGKDIARRRMLLKYNREKLRVVEAELASLYDIVSKLENYADNIYDKMEELCEELEEDTK